MSSYQTPTLDQEPEPALTSEPTQPQSLCSPVLPPSPAVPQSIPTSELNEQSLIIGRIPVLLPTSAHIPSVTSANVTNYPPTSPVVALHNARFLASSPNASSLGKRQRLRSLESFSERSKRRYPRLSQLASDMQTTLYPSPSLPGSTVPGASEVFDLEDDEETVGHNSRLLLEAVCAQRAVQSARKRLSASLAKEHAALHHFHQFQMEKAQYHLTKMESKIGSLRHAMRECGVSFPSRSPLALRQHERLAGRLIA